MIIDLPPNVEQQLIQTAQHQGVSVEKLIEKLVSEQNRTQPKQWLWLDTLRVMPKDDSFEQAILEGRQNLKADVSDWGSFE